MAQHDEPTNDEYPRGRGYGHDYMRGGEVFGGYGYSEREEYERRRGDLIGGTAPEGSTTDLGGPNDTDSRTPDRGT